MTVLVIADDRPTCTTIETLLIDDGYHCLTAKDTHEADLVLETIPVHGITLGLEIAGCRPMEWLKEISMLVPDLVRRTVVVAGPNPDDDQAETIRNLGAALVVKPFSVSEFREAVRSRMGVSGSGVEPVKPPAGAFRPIPEDTE